jgi:hypothetical protein
MELELLFWPSANGVGSGKVRSRETRIRLDWGNTSVEQVGGERVFTTLRVGSGQVPGTRVTG